MRIFVIRARKGSIHADKVLSQVGTDAHFEIIAHTLMNAFYISNGMRMDVEVYVVLDSSPDFPRTLKFSASQGLSFPGFHEKAILDVIAAALSKATAVKKNSQAQLAPGIEIFGFGFELLMQKIQPQYPVYLLDKKGTDARESKLNENAVFILSDHLSMPKNSVKWLEKAGLTKISFGKKMLFASQCVVLLHNELDRIAS